MNKQAVGSLLEKSEVKLQLNLRLPQKVFSETGKFYSESSSFTICFPPVKFFKFFTLPFLLLFRFPVPLALAPSSISLSSQGVSLLFTDWWYCDRDLTGLQNVSPLLWEPQGHRPICPCTMLKSLRVEAAEAGGGNVAKQMQQNQADCLRWQHRKKEKRRMQREAPGGRNTRCQCQWSPRRAASPAEEAQSLLLTWWVRISSSTWTLPAWFQRVSCAAFKAVLLTEFFNQKNEVQALGRKLAPLIHLHVQFPWKTVCSDGIRKSETGTSHQELMQTTKTAWSLAFCASELAHQHWLSCPYLNSLIP